MKFCEFYELRGTFFLGGSVIITGDEFNKEPWRVIMVLTFQELGTFSINRYWLYEFEEPYESRVSRTFR